MLNTHFKSYDEIQAEMKISEARRKKRNRIVKPILIIAIIAVAGFVGHEIYKKKQSPKDETTDSINLLQKCLDF